MKKKLFFLIFLFIFLKIPIINASDDNLAVGKPVTVSTNENMKQHAVDSRYSTQWVEEAGRSNGFLIVDLQNCYRINKIEISDRQDINFPEGRKNFSIFASNDSDFREYTVLGSHGDEDYGFKARWTLNVDDHRHYRYIKYQKTYSYASLSEIKIFGGDGFSYNQQVTELDCNVEDGGLLTTNAIYLTFPEVFNESQFNEQTVKLINETDNSLVNYDLERINSHGQFKLSSNRFLKKGRFTLIIDDIYCETGSKYCYFERCFYTVNQMPKVEQTVYLLNGEKTQYIGTGELGGQVVVQNNGDKKSLSLFGAIYNENHQLLTVVADRKQIQPEEKAVFKVSVQNEALNHCFQLFLFDDNLSPLYDFPDIYPAIPVSNQTIYVSQRNGTDSGGGASSAPVGSLERALQMAGDGANIILKDELYFVDNTIAVQKNVNIFGTNTTLTGGKQIGGWQYYQNGIYQAEIPQGISNVRQLYVNGERRSRARSKRKFMAAESCLNGVRMAQPFSIPYEKGMEIVWPNVEFRCYYMPVESINGTEITVKPEIFEKSLEYHGAFHSKNGFYLENSLNLLEDYGEWCYLPEENRIYYKPYPNENVNEETIFVPGVTTLLDISGVQGIQIKGVFFAHSGWGEVSKKGMYIWQSGQLIRPNEFEMVPAAVTISNCKNVNISHCGFKNLGTMGISLKENVTGSQIEDCVFQDISGTAISVGHFYISDENRLCKLIDINNNVIKSAGAEFFGSPGIQTYYTQNVTIKNNYLASLPYSGIAQGWGWDSNWDPSNTAEHSASPSHSNRIIKNKIIDVSQRNRDGGGIYTLGHNHNSVIQGNYILNQQNDYGAFYNDDGSKCYTVSDNVSENVPGWLYHWKDSIQYITAFQNFSTTKNDFVGLRSKNSKIESVTLFKGKEKPKAVMQIIERAGLENKEKEPKYCNLNLYPVFSEADSIETAVNTPVTLIADLKRSGTQAIYQWRAISGGEMDVWHGVSKSVTFRSETSPETVAVFSQPGDYIAECVVQLNGREAVKRFYIHVL